MEELFSSNFKFRLEQQPGETNRLGAYKVNMPNKYGVYLHGTNKPELFDKDVRIFSSGCVRVHEVEKFISEILSYQGVDAPLESLKNSKVTKKINLKNPLPVYLVYFTAWPDENGKVRFRNDIYNLDNALVSWF